jgi:hypothetical protein
MLPGGRQQRRRKHEADLRIGQKVSAQADEGNQVRAFGVCHEGPVRSQAAIILVAFIKPLSASPVNEDQRFRRQG